MTAITATPLLRTDSLNWPLLLSAFALASIGLVMVASASVGVAEAHTGNPLYYVNRHLLFLLMGLLGGCFIAAWPTHWWRQYGWLLLLVALAVLALVLIPGIGRSVNGARRWFSLGPISVQASEVAKFCLLVFFASYLSKHLELLKQRQLGFLRPLLILALVLLLLLLEPDFGTAVVLSATVLGMLFVAGLPLWQFLVLSTVGLTSLAALALLSPYRLRRLSAFLDPWADQFNSGYQLTQSLIAFGRGEWAGVGLGNSVQKLFYLPEAHTDFVFAILAEELGLLGVTVVIALFAVLVWQMLVIGRRAIAQNDRFGCYFACGCGLLFAGQGFINIGVATGLLPTKGLTLPFVSYGGSSLLVSCALVALLLRLDWEQRHWFASAEGKP